MIEEGGASSSLDKGADSSIGLFALSISLTDRVGCESG